MLGRRWLRSRWSVCFRVGSRLGFSWWVGRGGFGGFGGLGDLGDLVVLGALGGFGSLGLSGKMMRHL